MLDSIHLKPKYLQHLESHGFTYEEFDRLLHPELSVTQNTNNIVIFRLYDTKRLRVYTYRLLHAGSPSQKHTPEKYCPTL